MTNLEWQQRKEKVVANGMANLAPIYAASAKNALITDIEGKEYIDFAAGIAVNNTGHSHPQIVEAVKKQLDNFSHTCSMVTPYSSFVELAEQVVEIAPISGDKKAAFLTTGAEAVENAVKIARAATGRSGVLAFKGGFHGRTNLCMGLTGKVAPYKAGFGPFPNEIYHLPFPNAYHGVTEQQSLDALNDLFACDIEPSRVAAMIVEPIQGEGGFYQAPASWAQQLREICDKHGIVLICDEIQTGYARTGKWFATEYLGIEPDLITMAKGMAGGFPLSGVVGKAAIMDAANPGGIGGTYAGSPLACTAALEVIDIIKKENLCEQAQHIGLLFKEQLVEMQKSIAQIGDIRQVGAMIAIELNDPQTKAPLADITKKLVANSNHAGVILLSCGVKGNVIRFLPPLTIEPELVVKGLEIVKAELQKLIA
ncbi:4-aminobutyrate aminotransferase / (S)-3-amino-2-methylpropionate transaminase [Vibrio xiamenensis]|uniref:4-aminobutyrate aminotransferase / (S)-3-amino-2-methylpropionate transaminase n=1 Tax=Vibrio xiamenensis TaxID=861298 RepID=A0A1G8BXH4_9VIBR|nr:4-aminobutyrate--2-oxoglutarate transaminase [Vibrio xiamenensis]SDH37799.1 4-aminobutyrate aminotransferase / (S)-3-amino-2-methylpropionate transaminase [Vibrio xiamenensis]